MYWRKDRLTSIHQMWWREDIPASIDKMFLQYEVKYGKEQDIEQNSSFMAGDMCARIMRGNLDSFRQKTFFVKPPHEVSFFGEKICARRRKRDTICPVLHLIFYERTEKYTEPTVCQYKLFREQEEPVEFRGRYGIWDVIPLSFLSDKISNILREVEESPSVISFLNKIMNEDYGLLSTEIDHINHADVQSAYAIADNFERGVNYAKLVARDPLERRKYEDFQWNLIEIKRKLWALRDKKNTEKLRKELESLVEEVKDKLLACEEAKRIIRELGFKREDIFKDFEIKELPDGRVEYIWKKSG